MDWDVNVRLYLQCRRSTFFIVSKEESPRWLSRTLFVFLTKNVQKLFIVPCAIIEEVYLGLYSICTGQRELEDIYTF